METGTRNGPGFDRTGLQFDQARKMKDLERENAWLRRLVADLSPEKTVVADVASGNL